MQFDSKARSCLTSNRIPLIKLTCLLTYVYGTSAAEAEDQQVKDEARLQVIHGSVDGPRARGHRTLITASAKIKLKKKITHTHTYKRLYSPGATQNRVIKRNSREGRLAKHRDWSVRQGLEGGAGRGLGTWT